MTTAILHLSDLHFGDPEAVLKLGDVSKVMGSLLAKAGPEVIVVLSGDISFKGQEKGYLEASQALGRLLDANRVPRNRVIVCPGNHDIVNSDGASYPFHAFDAWSSGLRNDTRCTFGSDSCRLLQCGSVDFLVLNSAYHGERTFGLIDMDRLDDLLESIALEPEPGRLRVAVLHHHLIPFSGRPDESTTRNAYLLLSRLIKYGVSLVLHGHQHALLQLEVGRNSMQLCGVGSFRYSTPGFVNGATIVRIDDSRTVSTEHYAVTKDAPDFLRAFTAF